MYLFFDTETTGLPKNYKAPVSDSKNRPRMIQLAWLTCDSDGNNIQEKTYIIKPEGFTIPKDSSDVHGITTDIANEQGIDLLEVLEKFQHDIQISNTIIAHNLDFDKKIIGAEFYRKRIENYIDNKSQICTMKFSTDICKIPGPYGYKRPKLAELHQTLFQTDFANAHDALADVQACQRCFFELKKQGYSL